VVVVTGGAQGIGKAYCQGLASEGAKVVVADIDEALAQATALEIERAGAQALAISADVSSLEDTERLANAAAARFGRIDGLVNNAAVFQRPALSRGPFEQISVEEWDRVMIVNVRGVFLCCRAVLPYFKQQRYGKVVNISSGTILQGTAGMTHYVTSKAALIGFTRSMAREVGEYNVTVNAVAPGLTLSVDEPNAAQIQVHQRIAQGACIKRVETPQDLIGTIIFLCSPDSDFVTGQTIVVNGGTAML
jgi:3-oxoacyl-[acyl-carrier protein] reductase